MANGFSSGVYASRGEGGSDGVTGPGVGGGEGVGGGLSGSKSEGDASRMSVDAIDTASEVSGGGAFGLIMVD